MSRYLGFDLSSSRKQEKKMSSVKQTNKQTKTKQNKSKNKTKQKQNQNKTKKLSKGGHWVLKLASIPFKTGEGGHEKWCPLLTSIILYPTGKCSFPVAAPRGHEGAFSPMQSEGSAPTCLPPPSEGKNTWQKSGIIGKCLDSPPHTYFSPSMPPTKYFWCRHCPIRLPPPRKIT